MANAINIPKPHLILGLCLPLAVLIGYLLAEPMESGSVAIVVLVLSVLCVPLLMKWHHPMLVLSWNACISPAFLPGRPYLWMLMAVVGLAFAVLNRAVNPYRRFTYIPSLSRSLLFLLAVVIGTALLTGGLGLRALGALRYGGKSYICIIAAVAGYFALTSQRIPRERVGLYLAMFFLPGLFGLLGNLAYSAGPSFYFLFNLIPASFAQEQITGDYSVAAGIVRLNGLTTASIALSGYLLARYGIRGVCEISKPWRLLLFLAAAFSAIACGFRSVLILFSITLGIMFFLEGLHRTKYLPALVGLLALAGLLVLPQANKLPLVIQRTLSFLPAKVDPMVREITTGSTEWRLEMWKSVLPEVPKYLIKGKGYSLNPSDLYLAQESAFRHLDSAYAGSVAAGDYHNGPLSVLIPFGAFGMIGFLWFAVAALRLLYRNYRGGDPALRSVNTLLLAMFAGKLILFFCVFGSFYSELFVFTGLAGLSVSLNGVPMANRAEAGPEQTQNEFYQEQPIEI